MRVGSVGARRSAVAISVFLVAAVVYVGVVVIEGPERVLGDAITQSNSKNTTAESYAGDLGGLKIRIPRSCVENVEYDGDPTIGANKTGAIESGSEFLNFRSFGIDAKLPEMRCKESESLQQDYRDNWLNPKSLWVSISVNAGEIYPGPEVADRHAKFVVSSISSPTKFWLDNYERDPEELYGLTAFVVSGKDPKTGGLARDSERAEDKFFHFGPSGVADTYISCGKTNVPRGVATCFMKFSMEPAAKASIGVRFSRDLLPKWEEVREGCKSIISRFAI